MSVEFNLMERHLDAPRAAAPGGRVVLSRLGPGNTVIAAAAPSVKLVLEGEELYQVGGRRIRVQAGEFLYLEPGADCLGVNRGETIGLCLMLPIAAGLAAAMPAETRFGRALALSTRTSSLGQRLQGWGREIARNPALGITLAPRIVAEVGLALQEPLAASRVAMDSLKAAKPSTRRELYQRLERARAFLHQHADRNVALAELANVAGLSQFHLARYFRTAFGSAPIAYHRALRLERAAELVGGGGSVTQAAEAAGYSDATALTHAFRRHFGQAPQQWAMSRH
jgi:AraC family transcriptional regulator